MSRLLIALLLAGCVGSAGAQSAAAVSTGGQNAADSTVSVKDNRPVNALCPQSGSLVKRQVDVRSERAVDCATSSPGRVYSRQDIDRTGATTTGGALRQLDPAIFH